MYARFLSLPAPRELLVLMLLLAAMWSTRFHYLDPAIDLPDASWAVFFLAGVLTRHWAIPALLLLNAGAIDYLALLDGVSSYCVTPAYPFLIPTYLTLWACGRWVPLAQLGSAQSLVRAAIALTLGVVGAFVISNASFYALAGYFEEMSALAYANAVARYFPGYLMSTALYSALALGFVVLVRAHASARSSRQP